jgi:aryl-alcohol dehydrogenase-like predicted oxidoreductase
MLERGAENGLLDYCGKNNIGVVTYSSLQQGLLAGGTININKFTPRDVRRTSPHYKEPEYSINLKLGPELSALAKQSGHTAAQLGIAWNLRRPEVTSALTGSRTPAEIEDTAKAADWQLTTEEIADVEKILAQRLEALKAAGK